MTFEKCQIAPGKIINIDKTRYAEFIKQYFFTVTNKQEYLDQAVAAGWVTL